MNKKNLWKAEKVKKGLIFSGLGLLFLLSMWFIFKPSQTTKQQRQQGINDNIPQATVEQMPDDKLKAYELGNYESRQEQAKQEMGKLSDYFDTTIENSPTTEGIKRDTRKIEGSLQRYEENSRLINSFYEEEYYDYEKEELKAELEALRALVEEQNQEEDEEAKQLALMEKSYQMAAKYLPTAGAGTMGTDEQTMTTKNVSEVSATELPQVEVLAEQKSAVSMLDQLMMDSAFIADYGASERNMGFHSLVNVAEQVVPRNTLKVVVDKTTTLQEGSFVVLRLSEVALLQGIRLSRNVPLVAQAKIEGNRMKLYIRSVEVKGRVFSVSLSAFDLDGQEGIFIPNSEEIMALKEVGAGVGGSVGTSFTFSSSAKDQIISEAARGVMQGASQLLQKKLRAIKVTLKGGHQLFLIQTK